MSTFPTSETAQPAEPLVAPAGLNLLGDQEAGTCCGGSCAVPEK
ncbi:MAG: hypothetical protein ACQEW8_08720 [Actinomycetota bacterium]